MKNKNNTKKKYEIKNIEKFITTITISVLIVILCIFGIVALLKNKKNISATSSHIYEISNEILDFSEEENTILTVDLTTEDNSNENEVINSSSSTNNNNSNNQTNNNVSSSNYYIKVNYQANVVNIYKKDSNGDLQPYKVMTCSTGKDTPKSGVYSVQSKWVWGTLFGHTPGTYLYGQYVTKIVGNILFHSVPYTAQNKYSLEYDQYDKLGTTASAGCVRLAVIDSKWIFDNMPYGTPVEFYADSNPGPMGKPATQKISDNIECRNWDPTDPDPNNPWITYTQRIKEAEEKAKQEEENKSNQSQNQSEQKTDIVEENKNEPTNNDSENDINNSQSETTEHNVKDNESQNPTTEDNSEKNLTEINSQNNTSEKTIEIENKPTNEIMNNII